MPQLTTRVPLRRPATGDRWVVRDGTRTYAAFVLDGEVVVVAAACPHKGGPLVEGIVRDGAVVCPWHWYTYDLRTGACRTTDLYALHRYPVVEDGGELFVEVPVSRARSWSELLRSHARGDA